tara:strand:- start:1033 stop:1179 length:147 start_codon:yes stop_codon:yes gene_type:complete
LERGLCPSLLLGEKHMPMVKGKKYPYTKKGMAAAAKAKSKKSYGKKKK